MKSRIMYDSTDPNSIPVSPADAVIAGYIHGGDPTRPWRYKDWAQFPKRRKLPIFVRSDPQNGSMAEDDAFKALRDLYDLGAFSCLIGLDIETALDAEYVATYGRIMTRYNYRVLPYGSQVNLFKLPPLGGRWVAAPGKHLDDFAHNENVRIVQNTGANNGYDESIMHEFLAEHGAWWI